MTRAQALAALGLSNCATMLTPDIVQEAFRREVWKHHPDAQGEAVGPQAGVAIDRIKEARDWLLKNIRPTDDFACRLCCGVGIVRHGKIGWRQCTACHGNGERL